MIVRSGLLPVASWWQNGYADVFQPGHQTNLKSGSDWRRYTQVITSTILMENYGEPWKQGI